MLYGGILTIVAFHMLNLYKVVSKGLHRAYYIIEQLTNVLRSYAGLPLRMGRKRE